MAEAMTTASRVVFLGTARVFTDEEVAGVASDCFEHRDFRLLGCAGLFGLNGVLIGCGFVDAAADEVADDQKDRAQQEGHAPSPAVEGVVGQEGGDLEDPGGEQGGECEPGGCPCTGEAAPLLVAVFDGKHHGSGVFAAGTESLQQSKQDQQDGRPDTDGGVGGQYADQRGGRAHEHDGEDQHFLATDFVPHVAEHDAAERAC